MSIGIRRIDDALEVLKRVNKGAQSAFGEGREDQREALKRARIERGEEIEGTRIGQTLGTNRTFTMLRELLGFADEADIAARNEYGIGLSNDRAERVGQVLGTIGADIVQDRGRSLWWLLNAPQAVGSTAQELALKKVAPDLFKSKPKLDDAGNQIQSGKKAYEYGIANQEGDPKKGYFRAKDGYRERLHEPGHVDLLQIPTGIGINASIGLLNPFGGSEGYKAVFEDEEDPSKTSNVLGEIAAKYIVGRTGGLLNWDDFKEARPDVSKDEYMRYKAFKHSKETDLNPFDDGQVTLPMGLLKYTNEGIHGPEVQFLGRSLPLAQGILPTAAALAGTAIGARGGVRSGLVKGLGSLAAGSLAGNMIEQERRKRNQAENERDQIGTIMM